MWRINIIYIDGKEASFKGNYSDINLEDALYYYNNYVKGQMCTATYQKFPIRNNPAMELEDKIAELQRLVVMDTEERLNTGITFEPGTICRFYFDVYVKDGWSQEILQANLIKTCKKAGINILHYEIADDVTVEYDKKYPSLSWERVLETNDAIFYRHIRNKEIKIYSKISCQESKGPICDKRLNETLLAISNGIIKPSFMDKNYFVSHNLYVDEQ